MARCIDHQLTSHGSLVACFAAAMMAAGSSRAEPRTIVFPSEIHSIWSPDGSGARIFYVPRMNSDGSQAHPVFYDDGHGHRTRIATVTRSMGVAWSPSGRVLFLQDNWGSNISDCYELSRTENGIRGRSLFKIVQRTPGHPAAAEKSSSHYYVHCDRWQTSNWIMGSVSGHTDTNPFHDFDHRFAYDVQTRRLYWRR